MEFKFSFLNVLFLVNFKLKIIYLVLKHKRYYIYLLFYEKFIIRIYDVIIATIIFFIKWVFINFRKRGP